MALCRSGLGVDHCPCTSDYGAIEGKHMKARALFAASLSLATLPAVAAEPSGWSLIPYPSVLPTSTINRGQPPGQGWSTIDTESLTADQPSELKTPSTNPANSQRQAGEKPAAMTPWIIGVGGGARIGIGEPTFAEAYGRVGYLLSDDIGLSLRPRYIAGNSDLAGQRNGQGAI